MKKTLIQKYIYIGLVSCLILFINVGIVFAESVVLSWSPPTTNHDETPLADLAGYKVYFGTGSGNYSQSIDVGDVETYQVNNLSTGVTYYFATTAYDTSYNESGYSSEVSKTFPAPDTAGPVISSIAASDVTSSSVTISWSTDEASDSKIEYGTSTAYGSATTLSTSMVTSHSQGISGLSASTVYHYRVRSSDASGNQSVSGDNTFTTSAPPDTAGPVISSIAASDVTSSSVTISWSTDEASDSKIEYGTSTAYGSATTLSTSMVTSHSQGISGLSASTVYHYRVRSSDASGNQSVSGDNTFTTSAPPDTAGPVISSIAASDVTSSSVTISWSTDEASDSKIEYGTSTAYGSATTLSTSMVTSHSQGISGLSASTVYHYRVRSSDASGNQSVSGDNTFTTSAPPDTAGPVISSIAASDVTSSSVTISWSTDEASDSKIEYGTSTAYGSSTTLSTSMVTSHSQGISGLSASTVYHYRVLSSDASGNQSVSGDNTFTTSAPPDTAGPVISSIAASDVTSSSVTISWSTDEASDSKIEYGTSTAYGSSTTLSTSMVTSHSQGISGLSASTVYHYRVRSSDASGNQSVSGDNTFTTSAPPATVTYYCDSDSDSYYNISASGTCTGTGCEPAGCQTTSGNDCNDDNPDINPDAADDTCDGVDDNCDGTEDNNYVITVSSCGTGVCSSAGQTICQSGIEVNSCTPGTPLEISETTCSDGLDNDCDGQVDEGCFPNIKVSNVLLSEDFSAGIPAEWSTQGSWSTDNKCGRTIDYPFEGSFAIADSSCTATGIDELVTPSIDTVSCNNVELTFSNQYDWYSGNIEVDVSSDGGATWTNNISVESDDNYPSPGWKDIDISSVADTADAQIKFKYSNSSSGGFWAFDNIWVTCQVNQLQFESQVQEPALKTIMITNNGTSELAIDTINIEGTHASEFSIGGNDNCTSQTLQPSETCTVDIIFTPAVSGAKSANITILSNDPDTAVFSIDAAGLGTNAGAPVPEIKVNGSRGIVNIGRNDNFSAAIELDPGASIGTEGDWWVLMEYRGRWYYYDGETRKWRRGYSFYKQGQLNNAGPIEVLNNSTRLSLGRYNLYFGVDTNMNANQDVEGYYYDTVTINVN